MQFDFVHDTQRIFRKLLRAVSFPGTVLDLSAESAGIDVGSAMNPALIGIALTLLDAEASFCLWPRAAHAEERLLSQLTYGRPARPEEARLNFTLLGADNSEPLRRAHAGTLLEPHTGATIVIEVEQLSPQGEWMLEGPGIAGSRCMGMKGFDAGLVALRQRRCAEYPLGLDLCFVDASGKLAAIPRTTRIRGEA